MASAASQKPMGSSKAIVIEEQDQSNNLVATYISSISGPDRSSRIDINVPKNSTTYARSILAAFLPAGYPHSVTKDYLEYQIYDSLQAFSSSIAGLLSSRAVLEGIGVGDSHASPTAALLLSVLQESMGRVASILFAHRLGTALEPECKMYRLAADVFNDAALILDCLSPAFPKASRVLLLSFSSVLRALCGVAAGSSKTSLSAHFATQGNLGELKAKDSSQETIISLMGMLAGSLVVSMISSQWATWTSLISLLAIHLGTNYLAVRAVSMRTINRQRANLIMSHFLDKVAFGADQSGLELESSILTPEMVSMNERVFERDGALRWNGGPVLGYCKIGVPLKEIISSISRPLSSGSYTEPSSIKITDLLEIFKNQGYIMWYDKARKTFLVVLKEGTHSIIQLDAWMHALYLAKQIENRGNSDFLDQSVMANELHELLELRKRSGFYGLLEEAGWDTDTGAIETRSGTRIRVKN